MVSLKKSKILLSFLIRLKVKPTMNELTIFLLKGSVNLPINTLPMEKRLIDISSEYNYSDPALGQTKGTCC